jgi:signal transduction histidine kinase
VRVSAAAADGEVHLDVADTGQGIRPEFLPHVFERFRQEEGSEGQGGLGLGLAIAHHLVQLHGGRISAHSEGLGHGARFSVRLPAVKPETVKPPARDYVASL